VYGTEPGGKAMRHQNTNASAPVRDAAARGGRRHGRMRAVATWPVGASAVLVVAGALAVGACGGEAKTEAVATPPPPVAPKPPSPQEIRDRVEQSTVRVRGFVPALESKASGTANYIGDGDFLTNSHVVAGMSSIGIIYKGDRVSATVKASNTCQDYAVLHVDHPPDGLVPAELGSSDDVEEGDEITAFGFGSSALNGGQSHKLVMKPGSVSATGLKSSFDPNLPKYRDLMEFDAMTRPGMSGGPVVDDEGKVIALITLGDTETDERYGIAIDEVKQELPALQAGRSPAATGMELFSLSRDTVYDLTGSWIPWKSLLFVVGVESGSPADHAKPGRIEEGDILLELEGERVRSVGDYCSVVESHEKGDTLTAGGAFSGAGDEVRLRLK
jgi:S1-C subfamily serine protease